VLLPQVGSQESVGSSNGIEGGLHEVTHGLGAAVGGGEDVFNPCKLENLFGRLGSDDASSSGGGHEAHSDGPTFAGHLCGDSVGKTDLVTPIAATNGNNGELSTDDSSSDGVGNLFGAFDAQTDVSVRVSNDDESLEAGSLSCAGLFLDRHDLHNFVLEGRSKEVVDDLWLFDGEREEVDVF